MKPNYATTEGIQIVSKPAGRINRAFQQQPCSLPIQHNQSSYQLGIVNDSANERKWDLLIKGKFLRRRKVHERKFLQGTLMFGEIRRKRIFKWKTI